MPGLDGASRSAITKVMQEWREAFDEFSECEGRIASLAETIRALEVKSADAANREEAAREKFRSMASSHVDDPQAVDEINAIVSDNVKGIMGVHVASGGMADEEVFA